MLAATLLFVALNLTAFLVPWKLGERSLEAYEG